MSVKHAEAVSGYTQTVVAIKKVTERLWISHAKQTAQDAAEYLEQWVPCDEKLIGEGDWIRTDRTREREVQP